MSRVSGGTSPAKDNDSHSGKPDYLRHVFPLDSSRNLWVQDTSLTIGDVSASGLTLRLGAHFFPHPAAHAKLLAIRNETDDHRWTECAYTNSYLRARVISS